MYIGIIRKQFGSIIQYILGIIIGQLILSLIVLRKDADPYSSPDDQVLASKPALVTASEQPQTEPELLMVGIMTTGKYLSTRACTVFNTWAKNIEGKVIFYTETNIDETNLPCKLPIVRLHGVENVYPPQKKSFMMLRHMKIHYGDKYRWFMRADDDVYVNLDNIHSLLKSIESREIKHYIGQAGIGTVEEHGRLGLGRDENFCMGGPGVILSAETLNALRPHIKSCLKDLNSNHEDVEVGRCIHKHLGLACTWAYEMMSLFYHSPTKHTIMKKYSLINKAVTLHPFKHPDEMMNIHQSVLEMKRHKIQTRIISLMDELKTITGKMDTNIPYPKNWFTVLLRHYYDLDSDVSQPAKYPSHISEGLSSAITHFMSSVNSDARSKSRYMEFRDLNYGFSGLIPNRGIVHILDMFMTFKLFVKRISQRARRHVHLEQRFVQPRARILDSSSLTLERRITIILPLMGRQEQFRRFLDNYEKEFLEPRELSKKATRLIVVLFAERGDNSSREGVRTQLLALFNTYPDFDSILVPAAGDFSRAMALDLGAKLCSNHDLMVFTDVDILFGNSGLTSIRLMANEGQSVYFPIVFSTFKNSGGNFYDDGSGYWRHFGYGVVALFKSDYIGMNLSIKGWGKEDVDLYDRFLQRHELSIVRACDPDFIHVYHPVVCNKQLTRDQQEMCESSKANNYLSTKETAKIILDNDILNYL